MTARNSVQHVRPGIETRSPMRFWCAFVASLAAGGVMWTALGYMIVRWAQ